MTEDTPRCSRCGNPRDRPGQAYCRKCHSAYQRAWRMLRHKMIEVLSSELLATTYGKTVSRETIEMIEKRSKG